MIRAEVIPNDVLLTIAGSIGNCCVVKGLEKANINQAIVKIRPKEDIDSDYLSIFLNSKYGKFQTQRLANGAVQLNVNFSEVGDIRVIIPSLEIQRELVAEIEIARESRKQKLAEADALLSSLDDYLLEQLGLTTPEKSDRLTFAVRSGQLGNKIDAYSNQTHFRKLFKFLETHELPILKLQDLAIDIFSGTTPTAGGDSYTEDLDGIPFVRSGEITKDGEVRETHELLIKPEIHNGIMRRSQLMYGDLLIAIVGATIGSVGVYNRSTPANINQAIAAVRLNNSVLPEYVRWFLSSPIGQLILDFFKRPVARANINLEEISQIPVPIPSIAIQEKIAQEVQTRRELARKLRSEAETQWDAAKLRFETRLLEG